MFNVPQIQTRLKGMNQQQLFEEGQANQNDALMFSLVNNENMNRQKTKQARMAQQAGQQQPPIKQQDLMAMAPTSAPNMGAGIPLQGAGSPQQMGQNQLPEEQGIGALPAPNLTKLAGGGITGVASPEHHYAGNYPNLVSTNPNGPGGLQYYFDIPNSPSDRTVFKTLRGELFGNEPVPAELNRLKGQFFKTPEEAQRALTQAQFDMSPSGIRKAAASSNVTNLLSQNQPTPEQETNNLNVPLYSQANNETAPASTPAAPWSPTPIVAPTIKASGIPLGKAPTAESAKQQANTFFNPTDIKNMFAEDVTETGVQNTQNAEALRRLMENRPVLGKKQAERIAAEEAKEPEEKENLKGMSLLEAGLAVMGGTSPYAFQNLGKASVGVQSYKEGLKDLKKAHDLRQQALDHIDDMRDAQTIGDQTLAFTEQQKAGDKMLAARHAATSGFASALGVSGQLGANIFEKENNNYFADRRANAQLAQSANEANARLGLEALKMNQPPEAIRTAQYLGEGNVQTGYNMGVAKQHATELYTKWGQLAYPNGNMGQPNEAFLKMYPSAIAYVKEGLEAAGFGKTDGGFDALPKGATLLKAPK